MSSIRMPIDSSLAGNIQNYLDSSETITSQILKDQYPLNRAKTLVDTLIQGYKNRDSLISDTEISEFIHLLCSAARVASNTQLQGVFLNAVAYYYYKSEDAYDVFVMKFLDEPDGKSPKMTSISFNVVVNTFHDADGKKYPGKRVSFLYAFGTFDLSDSEAIKFEADLREVFVTKMTGYTEIMIAPDVDVDHEYPCNYIMNDLNCSHFNVAYHLILQFNNLGNTPNEIYEAIISRRPVWNATTSVLPEAFSHNLTPPLAKILSSNDDKKNSDNFFLKGESAPKTISAPQTLFSSSEKKAEVKTQSYTVEDGSKKFCVLM